MKWIKWLILAILVAAGYRACMGMAQIAETGRKQERAAFISSITPDSIPPIIGNPVSPDAQSKAATIDPDKFCILLGRALREKNKPGPDTEYIRAMIERTAATGQGTLKFSQQDQIRHNRLSLGMTQCMVIASLGLPNKSNRSVGSYGVHQQWVYPTRYVYIENGILTSWQD